MAPLKGPGRPHKSLLYLKKKKMCSPVIRTILQTPINIGNILNFPLCSISSDVIGDEVNGVALKRRHGPEPDVPVRRLIRACWQQLPKINIVKVALKLPHFLF